MTLDEINALIDQRFNAFPKQLRAAARFVRENPEQIALNSLRATSEQAETHPSNLMRLVRELGFERFNEFRAPFKEWLSSRRSTMSDRVERLRERRRPSQAAETVQDAFANEIGNLRKTAEQIGVADLMKAVGLLKSAHRIFVVGLRSNYSAAFLFDYSCKLFMQKTILVDGRAGTLGDELRTVGKGDVVVTMTQRRYTRETLRLTEFAKEAGAAIISIVDSPLAPTAAISDVTLVGHAASKSLISSAVATVAVSQLLVSLLVGAMGERTTAMFRKAQHQLDWFDSLESD
jgi:DNA-binding MurR/RpiR family transcriptional regulator